MILGLYLGLAAFTVGFLGISAHCNLENSLHVALWHFALPLLFVAAGAGAVGRRYLRW